MAENDIAVAVDQHRRAVGVLLPVGDQKRAPSLHRILDDPGPTAQPLQLRDDLLVEIGQLDAQTGLISTLGSKADPTTKIIGKPSGVEIVAGGLDRGVAGHESPSCRLVMGDWSAPYRRGIGRQRHPVDGHTRQGG